MNKTIQDILTAEYYKAKRVLADYRQSLGFVTAHRLQVERDLASAKLREKELVQSCDMAEVRLRDIRQPLDEAKVFLP